MATKSSCQICGAVLSFSMINQREAPSIPPNVREGQATCEWCGAKYTAKIKRVKDGTLSAQELKIVRSKPKEDKGGS